MDRETWNSASLHLSRSAKPDVIVIGAGVSGCSTAWHLRQRGLNVLVLEAETGPAMQTTRAGAGFVCSWAGISSLDWQQVEWAMQQYGIAFYTRLAEECGRDIGFHGCGIAYITLTAAGRAQWQARFNAARRLGTKLEILDAAQVRESLPLIRFKATEQIVFDPDGIRIRASDAISALAAQLEQDGVRIQYGTTVTGFAAQRGQIHAVHTSSGPIECPQIVVAAGAWSRPLLHRLNVVCPGHPIVETRFVTQSLPGVDSTMPLLLFTDGHGFYIREEHGGLLIGGHDPEPLPADRFVDPDNPPPAKQLVPDQAYRVRQYLRDIEPVMPIVKRAEISQITSGLPTFTQDRRFVADRVPGYQGLYIITACQEAGITHGPGLGRLMSELIVDGRTTWERSAFRLLRSADKPVVPTERP